MKTKCRVSILALLLFCLLFSTQALAKDGNVIPAEGYATTLNTNPLLDSKWLDKQIILTEQDKTWTIRIADLGAMPMLLVNNNGTAGGSFTDAAILNAHVQNINSQLASLPASGSETVYDRTSGTYINAPAGSICQIRQEFTNLLAQTLAAQLMSDMEPADIQINLNDGYLVCFAAGGQPVIAGTCTTSLSGSSSNRINNVTVAASNLNGLVLQPGETLSISDAIKPRTAANGYREAGAYLNGEVVSALGGGICQVSSTTYNAAMNSGLTILERHPHSMPVHYLPLGLDAAISAGSKDLKLRNDYDLPVTIQAGVSGKNLTISIVMNSSLLRGQTYKLWSTVTGHNAANTYLSTYDASGAETGRTFVGSSRYSDPKPKTKSAEED